jgi:iron-sulfur cluster repair protein YtfE (RIC family)
MEEYLHEVETESSTSGQEDLVMLLFYKLKDELEQMLRNDRIIVFPLIRREIGHANQAGMPLPTAMIHQMHKKILKLLDKLRLQVNSYLVKPEWSESFKLFCDELFTLDQQIQQAIYIKENVLLKKAPPAASNSSIHD